MIRALVIVSMSAGSWIRWIIAVFVSRFEMSKKLLGIMDILTLIGFVVYVFFFNPDWLKVTLLCVFGVNLLTAARICNNRTIEAIYSVLGFWFLMNGTLELLTKVLGFPNPFKT